MNEEKVIPLEAARVRFFSTYDEAAFFEWLKKLPCIISCEGIGRVIHLQVNAGSVDEDALRELLSLFRRYGIAMQQLSAFDQDQFADWFHDKRAYWYAEIWGTPTTE